jgi:hypothetical protein
MESHFATEAVTQLRRRSLRAAAVNLIGPLTMLAGVAWAFLQPYRLTILHPYGQGFWWLLSEPPLYVILVGLAFAVVLAPALLEDLEEAEDAAES